MACGAAESVVWRSHLDQPAETPEAGLARLLTDKLGLRGSALSARSLLPWRRLSPAAVYPSSHAPRASLFAGRLALPAALLTRLRLDGIQ